MKEITLDDCLELEKQFHEYTQTAEQHQFPLLLMLDYKLQQSIVNFDKNKSVNQNEARAMFRVILQTIGKDFSEYVENQ